MPRTAKYNSTLYNPEYLKRRYVDEDLNASQIAAELGCQPSAVLDALARYGIPKKTMSEVLSKVPQPGSHAPRPRTEFKDTLHNREWLEEHFVTKKQTASEIARTVGCSPHSACQAIYKILGLESTTRSPLREDVLHEYRGRAIAARMYPVKQPCIVCGGEGTKNHINGDTHSNHPSNIEWLCLRHHLMVDKRLAASAARWLRSHFQDVWLQWHDQILAEVQANPNKTARGPLFDDSEPESPQDDLTR